MININKCISKSLFAGLSIGIAGCVYLSISNTIIGALLFSVGLLSCVISDSPLFTGKSGFLSDRYDIRRLILVLLMNLIGAYLFGLLSHFTINNIVQSADGIVSLRLNADISELIMKSILTGFLMTLAIESENRQNSNHLILIMSVVAFILSGSYHCIADAFYYGASSLIYDNVGQILLRLFIVIVFNFIGCNLYNLAINRSIIHSDTD